MEPNKPIKHYVAGSILAGILIVYSLSLQFAGAEQNNGLQWVSHGIFIAGLIVFVNIYGKANNYTLSFGNLFGYGFKATAITTLIVIVFTAAMFAFMPDLKEKILDAARKSMEEQNKMSDEEIDKAIDLTKRFLIVFMIGGILLSYAIFGAIGSLIGAAITKKRPYNPLDQLDMK